MVSSIFLGSQCSWVAQIVLVRGDVISLTSCIIGILNSINILKNECVKVRGDVNSRAMVTTNIGLPRTMMNSQ